ncbi:MAG: hypothetical protein ACOCP8_01030 [archaeon]
MSYCRGGYFLFVIPKGHGDYVFRTEHQGVKYIEDYGGMKDDTFIELLCKEWDTNDLVFKEHYIRRLSDRLNVILQKNLKKRLELWRKKEYDFEEKGLEIIDLYKEEQKND